MDDPVIALFIRVALDEVLLVHQGHLHETTDPCLLCWVKTCLVIIIVIIEVEVDVSITLILGRLLLGLLLLARLMAWTVCNSPSIPSSSSCSHRCCSATSSRTSSAPQMATRWDVLATACWLWCVGRSWRDWTTSRLIINESDNQRPLTGHFDSLPVGIQRSIVVKVDILPILRVAVVEFDDLGQQFNLVESRGLLVLGDGASSDEAEAHIVTVSAFKFP